MAKRIRFATMTLAALLGMPMLAVMIPPGSADATVTVTYSSFGPGLSFATGANSVWCVSGSNTSSCTTENSRVLAVPIVPQATFVLSEVQLPLNYFSGTNTGVVSLVGSIGGVPGGPVLESWSLSNLPVGPSVTTLTSTGGVTLQAGMTYWLEASPTSLTDDTLPVWYRNNRSLASGLNDISGAGWTGLIPSVLPAYAVTGTQATASSAGAGCTGSNPQTCLPVPPSPAANADLLGSNNEASEAPPELLGGRSGQLRHRQPDRNPA